MAFEVYTLSCPVTGINRYCGKTERGVDQRIREHRYFAKKGRTHLHAWWRKCVREYGMEPVIEVLQTYDTIEALNAGEKFWIKTLRNWGCDLTNHSDGGEGNSGWRHTPESKAKISAKNKGIKKPGVRAAQLGNKNCLGRIQNPEEKARRSASMMGKQNGLGHSPTEEERARRSVALGGGGPFMDQNGTIHNTVRGAEKQLGISRVQIRRILRGGNTRTKFRFTYLPQQQSF